MTKFILAFSMTVVLAATCSLSRDGRSIFDLAEELPWTSAINQRVCENGSHPDNVAEQFFACYREEVTPGGSKFVECQEQIYGVLLNSEANLDKGCALPADEYFKMYDVCITKELVEAGESTSNTWHKLNECQGAALGVPAPTARMASITT